MRAGEVYLFNYLWGHEADRGEETGRKTRRVCVILRRSELVYLFPLSSRPPRPRPEGGERVFVVVPDAECRRIGLAAGSVSHLILDDYNRVHVDVLHDFGSPTPVGSLSQPFLALAARRFLEAVRQRTVEGRVRT